MQSLMDCTCWEVKCIFLRPACYSPPPRKLICHLNIVLGRRSFPFEMALFTGYDMLVFRGAVRLMLTKQLSGFVSNRDVHLTSAHWFWTLSFWIAGKVQMFPSNLIFLFHHFSFLLIKFHWKVMFTKDNGVCPLTNIFHQEAFETCWASLSFIQTWYIWNTTTIGDTPPCFILFSMIMGGIGGNPSLFHGAWVHGLSTSMRPFEPDGPAQKSEPVGSESWDCHWFWQQNGGFQK